MRVLVLNSGSSTIKYKLFEMDGERVLASGQIAGLDENDMGSAARNHDEALDAITSELGTEGDDIDAIGHRVVHGGADFSAPAIVDDAVLTAIEANAVLAPLHNPPALHGIQATRRLRPDVPQVAVFDTAFHRTIPPPASTYPLPDALAQAHGLHRYGFHGTSCAWSVAAASEHFARRPGSLNLIIAHLGAGASITAVKGGRSVDTSMGVSPLEGVMMQTRSGDMDPSIVLMLLRSGKGADEIEDILNHQSGVKAISGDADMLTVAERAEAGAPDATLARAMYVHRIRKYIGGYAGLVWPLDALIFTGGIGENDAWIRRAVCEGLPQLGLVLDEKHNEATSDITVRSLHASGSRVDVLVVRADEELQIARDTVTAVTANARPR